MRTFNAAILTFNLAKETFRPLVLMQHSNQTCNSKIQLKHVTQSFNSDMQFKHSIQIFLFKCSLQTFNLNTQLIQSIQPVQTFSSGCVYVAQPSQLDKLKVDL